MPQHEVVQGECLSSIAAQYGLTWQVIWNDPDNADLRQRRKDPNVIHPGDVLHVPELRLKEESRPTDASHKFRRKGVPVFLKLQLLDGAHKPLDTAAYVLTIDGKEERGSTDDQGFLKHPIKPNAQQAMLRYKDGEKEVLYELQLGGVDPLPEDTGPRHRLENLGFYCGEPEQPEQPEQLAEAVRRFQEKHDLESTGELDEATKSKLEKVHGC